MYSVLHTFVFVYAALRLLQLNPVVTHARKMLQSCYTNWPSDECCYVPVQVANGKLENVFERNGNKERERASHARTLRTHTTHTQMGRGQFTVSIHRRWLVDVRFLAF